MKIAWSAEGEVEYYSLSWIEILEADFWIILWGYRAIIEIEIGPLFLVQPGKLRVLFPFVPVEIPTHHLKFCSACTFGVKSASPAPSSPK